jgi:branched-chain amino acid transport system permease protein
MNIKQGFRQGLVVLAILFYLDIIGIPLFVGESAVVALAAIVGLFTLSYVRRDNREEPKSWVHVLVHSLMIGLVAGIGFALVTYLFATLQGRGMRIEEVFAQIKADSTAILTGLTVGEVRQGGDVIPGLIKLVLFFTGGGLVGGLLARLFLGRGTSVAGSDAGQKAKTWGLSALPFLFYALFIYSRSDAFQFFDTEIERSNFGLMIIFLFIGAALFSLRAAKPGRQKIILAAIVVLLVLVLPQIANLVQNAVLGAVMIFIVMGIGLNIVVGYAGLLDLGYVAFFAVGAYTYGLLSSPESFVVVSLPWFEGVTFWVGLPIAFLIGAFTGVLLGAPVLNMRGDYLAIVTLGFGEIIRLLVLNLRDYTGGPGGVLKIPSPNFFGLDLGSPQGILYLAMALGVLVTIVTLRLHDSRLGRAWVALREDEDVAEAMGINLVAIKLLAFGSGAAFAALGGAVYAARQVNIFPDNFALDVSINVLSLIIIGGIGSIEGVVLGAIALIGLPEILRSVSEYRIIAFGALLVVMMIIRPEGFLPSTRRARELHEHEAHEHEEIIDPGLEAEV